MTRPLETEPRFYPMVQRCSRPIRQRPLRQLDIILQIALLCHHLRSLQLPRSANSHQNRTQINSGSHLYRFVHQMVLHAQKSVLCHGLLLFKRNNNCRLLRLKFPWCPHRTLFIAEPKMKYCMNL